MTQTTLSPVVRHIRRLVAVDASRELSDSELLERFAADREERAFAALFRRHGPLVWSVCYSVLHHRQDTEDAFQATFLLLARRAGSIRKTEAVASWLYRVAHRVATKAGQNMARRRFQEEPLPQPRNPRFPDSGRGEGRGHRPVSPPEAEAAWRELQALLNEEVQRLPEKYRAPFILCCLEGKTGPEAARQLGWKVGTVTGRLTEARQLLQRRLSRRGVALSSILTAATIAQARAATACAALAEGTVKAALAFTTQAAAAGLVSAKAAALVEAMAKQLVVGKLKVATAVLVAVSVVTGAGALMHQALAGKPVASQASTAKPSQKTKVVARSGDRDTTATPLADDKDSIRYSGRVLGPDGQPVAGAKLYLTLAYGYEHPSEELAESATTGPDGRFQFAVPKTKYPDMPTFVGAMAANYGVGWVMVPAKGKSDDLTLQLAKDDVPITGEIVDLQGKPVPGATLTLLGIQAAPEEDLGPWLKAVKAKKGLSLRLEQKYLTRYTVAVSGRVTTDAQGRFRLTGIGRNRLARVQLDGPTIVSQRLYILTRAGETTEVLEDKGNPEYGEPRRFASYYGANFRHVAAPTKPIIGVVRDKDTKKGLPGVTVRGLSRTIKPGRQDSRGLDIVTTTTDPQGRYRLVGMPKGEGYKIVAIPAGDQPYVVTSEDVPETPGLDPVTVDFELKRGVWIAGKITDKVTGKPVRALVEYYSMYKNPNLQRDYPGFIATIPFNLLPTKDDGSYRVVGLPGPGLVAVHCHIGHYLRAPDREDEFGIKEPELNTAPYAIVIPSNFCAIARIDPSNGVESVKQDLTVDPGWTFKVRLLGPDGKPLAGVRTFVTGDWDDSEKTPATFTVRGFNPRRPHDIFFQHLERGLVGMAEPPKVNGASSTVQMEPGAVVTGRLLDAAGRPRAGTELELAFRLKEEQGYGPFPPEHIQTDQEGRFRITALLPKYEYRLSDGNGELHISGGLDFGKTTDLGDVKMKSSAE